MNTPAQVAENYLGTGKTKVSLSFGRMLALAILAGIYIALAGVGGQLRCRNRGKRFTGQAGERLPVSGRADHGAAGGQ